MRRISCSFQIVSAVIVVSAAVVAVVDGQTRARVPAPETGKASSEKVVFNYYYTNGGTTTIADLDCSQFTHLIWAFANVDADGTVSLHEPPTKKAPENTFKRATGYDSEKQMAADCKCGGECIGGEFYELQRKRLECPHIKLLISVGGWGWSHNFSLAMRPSQRKKFVSSSFEIVDKYGFDGIDIDWEFPAQPRNDPDRKYHAIPQDHANLNEALALMKTSFKSGGKNYLITMALRPANFDNDADWGPISASLDYGLFMAYTYGLDVKGGRFVYPSGLDNPYSGSTARAERLENARGALKTYTDKNFNVKKMAFGIPLFSYSFSAVCDNLETCPAGLTNVKRNPEVKYQAIIRKHVETGGAQIKHVDVVELGAIKVQGAGKATDIFFVETLKTIKAKLDFVNTNELAGFMYWNSNDDMVGKYSVAGYIKDALNLKFAPVKSCGKSPKFCNVECGKPAAGAATTGASSGAATKPDGTKKDAKPVITGNVSGASASSGVQSSLSLLCFVVAALVQL